MQDLNTDRLRPVRFSFGVKRWDGSEFTALSAANPSQSTSRQSYIEVIQEHIVTLTKLNASDEPDLVSSFAAAFSGTGPVASVCIKFAMYNGTFRLSQWEALQLQALYQCIEHYSGVHYYGSDLQRMSDDSSFGATLPTRHPVRTMLDERPILTKRDYQIGLERHRVKSLVVVDRGDACEIRCTYVNESQRSDLLPVYIAMNLYGALRACINLSGTLASEVGGPAPI
ncbi:hypothetical protein [Burkholderia sp. BCC1644]|uniref:hypothetical protein n=1 Tax=Burkholderia sp. BCC1644 TaxID=2676293 RepID=UPI0015901191|nr:hypothetical protein [Burkholderia sp. BCC1644]